MDNLSGNANWKLSDAKVKKEKKVSEKTETVKKPKEVSVVKPNFVLLDTLIDETNTYYKVNNKKAIGDILIMMHSLQKAIKNLN